MATEMDLAGEKRTISTGNDSIVIINALGHIDGGAVVTVPSSYKEEVIKAGHVVIQNTTSGEFELLGLSSGAYASIGSGKKAVGVVKTTVLTEKPLVSIVTIGQVNKAASPYGVTSAIETALPRIEFI